MAKQVDSIRQELIEKFIEGKNPKPPESRPYLAWASDPKNPKVDKRKTLAMRLVESHFNQPIEKLLSIDQRGVDVARKLGITAGCVTRWRERMGMRDAGG